jgi:hypothetical protein
MMSELSCVYVAGRDQHVGLFVPGLDRSRTEIPESLLARGRKARVCDYDSGIARARRVHDLLEVTIARGTNHQTPTRSTSLLIDAFKTNSSHSRGRRACMNFTATHLALARWRIFTIWPFTLSASGEGEHIPNASTLGLGAVV